MRVWTVQPVLVWEQVQQSRQALVDPLRINSEAWVPDAYHWLVCQLRRRLPGYDGDLPWWAYCEKPDLRWVRHRRPLAQREVRIELELPPERVFAMPCWAWDVVYGGDYLCFTEAEHADWTQRLRTAVLDEDCWPLPEPWLSEVEASWERLFSADLPAHSWDEEDRMRRRRVLNEAVFGQIRHEDVRGVTPFLGARPPRALR